MIQPARCPACETTNCTQACSCQCHHKMPQPPSDQKAWYERKDSQCGNKEQGFNYEKK